MIKVLTFGDNNIAGLIHNPGENFAKISLTEKIKGMDVADIPFELRDAAIIFKTEESLDNFIDWLMVIRTYYNEKKEKAGEDTEKTET